MLWYISVCSMIGGISVSVTTGLGAAIVQTAFGDNQVRSLQLDVFNLNLVPGFSLNIPSCISYWDLLLSPSVRQDCLSLVARS